MPSRPNCRTELEAAMRQRILVIDGAMGTTIRGYGLKEADAAISTANKARADMHDANTRDPASVLRDDDSFRRPD